MKGLSRIQRGMYQAKTDSHHYFVGQADQGWKVTAYPTNGAGVAQSSQGTELGLAQTLSGAATMVRGHRVQIGG